MSRFTTGLAEIVLIVDDVARSAQFYEQVVGLECFPTTGHASHHVSYLGEGGVLYAGDAAGVVAPASGEGIYYAMAGGRYAADAAQAFLATLSSAEAKAVLKDKGMEAP